MFKWMFGLMLMCFAVSADAQTLHSRTTWAFETDYSDGRVMTDDDPSLSGLFYTFDNFPWTCERQSLTATKFNQSVAGFYCHNKSAGWIAVMAFCDINGADEDEEKIILGDAKAQTVILKATCKTVSW
jgi:hypothetical protein